MGVDENRPKPAYRDGTALTQAGHGTADVARHMHGARVAAMPNRVEPMLGTLIDEPFSDDDWLFEVKWDGYRALCYIADGTARLISRNGLNLGPRYPFLGEMAGKVHAKTAVLDGELVALDSDGKAQFQLLQTAMHPGADPLIAYYVFDILYFDGVDVTGCTLADRKQLLQSVLVTDRHLRYSDHVIGKGRELYERVRDAGVEGLMAKRADSKYEQRRSRSWLKIKIRQQADVVIGGYTEPRGSRRWIGSLIAGVYHDGVLIPIGHVSVGSSESGIRAIYDRLKPLETGNCPFVTPPRTNDVAHWLAPRVVAEVEFGEWTRDGQMRHPNMVGFRDDKAAADCVRETEQPRHETMTKQYTNAVDRTPTNRPINRVAGQRTAGWPGTG